MRARVLTSLFLAVLAAAAAWALARGRQSTGLQPDEFAFVLSGAAAFAEDFLGTLLDPSPVNRGPERLMGLIVWVPYAAFEDTPAMFRAAQALTAVVYVLGALPAYALARALRLERWQALAVAALAVVTPWLLFATTMLNVTAAFPLTTALVWAIVRTVTRPSPLNDLLVLAVAALGAAARTGHLPFVAAAAVAIFVGVWRDRPAGEPVPVALRRWPLRLVRTHPVLVGAGALTLVAVAAVGATGIIGGQYRDALPADLGPGLLVSRAGIWASILALGSGGVVLAVALPWAIRQAARPTDRTAGAFAVTALSLFVIFVVSTVQAPIEERYVAVLGALAPVAFGAAVFRRELSVLGTLLGALVVLRVVTANVPGLDQGSHGWMVGPARQFWYRAVDRAASPEVGFLLLAVAVGLVAAGLALLRHRALEAAAAAVTLGVLLTGFAAADRATARWQDGPGGRTFTWEERAFLDEAVGDGPVLGWDYNPDQGELVPYALGLAQAYNRSFDGVLRLEGMPQTWSCCGQDVRFGVDPARGRIRSEAPLPRYVVAPPGFRRVGFAARVVATSPALADFPLLDLGARPLLSYVVENADDDGWLEPRRPARVRAFADGGGGSPSCVRLVLQAPGAPARYRVGSDAGELAPDETRELRVPVRADRPLRVRANGGATLADGRVRAVRMAEVEARCPA